MKTKYLSPLVCKVIAEMLLNREVEGDILLKDGTTVHNGFIDVKDGSSQPYKIASNDYWYTRNLRYTHGHLEKQERAIVGFENTKDIAKLERRVYLIDSSFCLYKFNKKARKLILQLVKEGKLKGKIIIANGDTLDTDWRENEDRVYVGEWWYNMINAQWQTSGERRKDYEFAGFTNSEDLKTLAEAYYG